MIVNYSPLTQALLGTLFTWGVTAAGSAMVFVFRGGQVRHALYRKLVKCICLRYYYETLLLIYMTSIQ